MAFIESHQDLERHPKTLELMGSMDWDLDTTIGKLHRFWWWCLSFAPTGDLRGKNDSVLAGSVGLAQQLSKRFVDNMVAAGWLDRDNGVFRVHDWIDYAGPYLRDSKFKRRPELWASTQNLYADRGKGSAEACQQTVSRQSTLPTHPTTHPPGGGNGATKSGHVVSDVRSELRLAGVKSNRKVAECAEVRGVSPVAVALLAEELRKKQGIDVGAVLASRLTNGFLPPVLVEPEAVSRLAKTGRVLSVCGHDARGKPVRYGKDKLHVGDVSIPASELKPEQIQLTRGDT